VLNCSYDEKARDMIQLAVGLYKFHERVDGFLEQSLYWALLGFEYIIRSVYGEECERKDLKEVIGDLSYSKKLAEEDRSKLDRFRIIRNKMFHPKGYVDPDQAADTLQDLCRMVKCNFEVLLEDITYEQVRQLRDKVLKIPRHSPCATALEKPAICESDFDDLDSLYEKCEFLHFRKLVTFLSPLGLRPEEMSELIPTSGTVWLPWVVGKAGPRWHIETIVLGISFTPNHVRMGIDFGSQAYESKEAYYRLLLAGRLDNHLARLVNSGFQHYDTYWYYNVRNVAPISEYYAKKEQFRSIADSALLEIETKKHRRKLMKNNRLLVGRIFNRGSPEFNSLLTKIPETARSIFSELLLLVNLVEQSTHHAQGKVTVMGTQDNVKTMLR
jgi:hypothetical protein